MCNSIAMIIEFLIRNAEYQKSESVSKKEYPTQFETFKYTAVGDVNGDRVKENKFHSIDTCTMSIRFCSLSQMFLD